MILRGNSLAFLLFGEARVLLKLHASSQHYKAIWLSDHGRPGSGSNKMNGLWFTSLEAPLPHCWSEGISLWLQVLILWWVPDKYLHKNSVSLQIPTLCTIFCASLVTTMHHTQPPTSTNKAQQWAGIIPEYNTCLQGEQALMNSVVYNCQKHWDPLISASYNPFHKRLLTSIIKNLYRLLYTNTVKLAMNH